MTIMFSSLPRGYVDHTRVMSGRDASAQVPARVQDQKNFVKGCYRTVTIPILLIMPLTCAFALSTTFTGYLVWLPR